MPSARKLRQSIKRGGANEEKAKTFVEKAMTALEGTNLNDNEGFQKLIEYTKSALPSKWGNATTNSTPESSPRQSVSSIDEEPDVESFVEEAKNIIKDYKITSKSDEEIKSVLTTAYSDIMNSNRRPTSKNSTLNANYWNGRQSALVSMENVVPTISLNTSNTSKNSTKSGNTHGSANSALNTTTTNTSTTSANALFTKNSTKSGNANVSANSALNTTTTNTSTTSANALFTKNSTKSGNTNGSANSALNTTTTNTSTTSANALFTKNSTKSGNANGSEDAANVQPGANVPIVFGEGFSPSTLNTGSSSGLGTTPISFVPNKKTPLTNTVASWRDQKYTFGKGLWSIESKTHTNTLYDTEFPIDVTYLFDDFDVNAIKSRLRTAKLSEKTNTTVGTFFPEPNSSSVPYKFDVSLEPNEFAEVKDNIKAILQSVREVHTHSINQLIDDDGNNVEKMTNELEAIILAIGTVVTILSRVYVCVVVSEYLTTKSPSTKSTVEDKKKKIEKLKDLLTNTIPLLLKLENQNNNISI